MTVLLYYFSGTEEGSLFGEIFMWFLYSIQYSNWAAIIMGGGGDGG